MSTEDENWKIKVLNWPEIPDTVDEFEHAEFERKNQELVNRARIWGEFDGLTYRLSPNIFASLAVDELNDKWIRWKAHKIVARVEASR